MPALRLEVFAELSARLAGGEKRSEVLESAKVTDEHWESSQQFWLGRMADEAARNRFSLNQRYSALYKAALARRTVEQEAARRAPRRRKLLDADKVVVHAAPAVPAFVPPSAVPPPAAPPSSPAVAPPALVAPALVPPSAPSVPAPPSSVPTSVRGVPSSRPYVEPPAPVSAPLSSAPRVPPAPVSSAGRMGGGLHVARLTVEQLAAMRAELATSPEAEHMAVRQRFGLDDSTWELEEAYWQRQLASDKDLFARYLRSFQYCRSLLQRA